jgi:ankyrin repeat protein
VAQLLLDRGADVNAQNSSNCASILLALVFGHLDIAQILLDCGADANAQNKNNLTPLHASAKGGHSQVAQLLLNHGADASARDRNNNTAVELATTQVEPDYRCRAQHHVITDAQPPLRTVTRNPLMGSCLLYA